MRISLLIVGIGLFACALLTTFDLYAQEFTVTYGGQATRTWNWSDGSRDRITINAAGTVLIRPDQITCDETTFQSSTADLVTSNHVWGTAIEDGSVPTQVLNFDETRLVSRLPSSTYSHFTPETGNYLYFETEDSIYAPPNTLTVYAWEYVSSLQVMRLWVALPNPFYYPDASYEHYNFPATHVVAGQSAAHSCLFGTVVDSNGAVVSGAQVVFGGVSTTSDAQGTFKYEDIPPASYSLTITRTGFVTYSNVEPILSFSILTRTYTLEGATLTLSMHRADENAIANAASGVDIDAPLELVSDANALEASTVTPITMGLVADGVTPLLIKLIEHGASTAPKTYRISLSEPTGGSVAGGVGSHLRVLQGGSFVGASSSGTASTTVPAHTSPTADAFAYVSGIRGEDLIVSSGQAELICHLSAQALDSAGNPLGNSALLTFKIRTPPVALIHGIADDDTTWSATFRNALAAYRPMEFIMPIKYGVGFGPKAPPFVNVWPNATGRFDDLAGALDDALQNQVEVPLRANWACTRYDLVGHSQGGVLARMLCQNGLNSAAGRFVQSPVVSRANFFRGRFGRIITIGSPHNGTLIGWYIWKIHDSADPHDQDLISKIYNTWFSILAFATPDKFNPFGSQIAEINNPLFPVDPRLKFNCIQTAINGGAPPDVNPVHDPRTYPLSYISLGLWYPTGFSGQSRGQVIIPNGSDGVVDFDSEGAGSQTPKTPIGANTAHADVAGLFGLPSGHSQTTSPTVADTVGALLNGPANRFASFKLPALLTPADEQRYEQTLVLGTIVGTIVRDLISLLPVKSVQTNLSLILHVPADFPNVGPINWAVQVYGTNGITTNGVTLEVSTNDSTLATVSVDNSVQGQVVSFATYTATNGVLVFAKPTVIATIAEGSALVGIVLNPPSAVAAPGDILHSSIWGTYSNGERSLLFVPPGDVTYSSSDTYVASVDANGAITVKAFGFANITAVYGGFTGQMNVATAPVAVRNVSGETGTNGTFKLSWLGTAGARTFLEMSTNLADWMPLATNTSSTGFGQFLDSSATNRPVRFYRVRAPGVNNSNLSGASHF